MFFAGVDGGDYECEAGEESGFEEAKKEAEGDGVVVGFDETCADCYERPADCGRVSISMIPLNGERFGSLNATARTELAPKRFTAMTQGVSNTT